MHGRQCLDLQFAGINTLNSFDLKEAQHERSWPKRDLHGVVFSNYHAKKFWTHVSRHFDNTHGYRTVNILTQLSCFMLPDSSIAKEGMTHITEFTQRRGLTSNQCYPQRFFV